MRQMTALRIGDQVKIYWRGYPEELGKIKFIRDMLIIPILGPFCNVWRN